MSSANHTFEGRWAVVLASLGMAIGAGNLWRFPRLVGQYGGTFICLWFLFLFVWSLPILLTEFALGKQFKSGVVKSFERLDRRFRVIGIFLSFITLGIAMYYAVVTAWAAQYIQLSLSQLWHSQPLDRLALQRHWGIVSNGNIVTVGYFVATVLLSFFTLRKGVRHGLEKVNKILIPALFFILGFIVLRTLFSESGRIGLWYMLSIDTALFSNYKVWIEALSQSAWSTGAGWGLLLTLAAYSKEKEDVIVTTLVGGLGNNFASLLAAAAILPTVFSMSPSIAEAVGYLKEGNQSLLFVVIPQLFSQLFMGDWLMLLFFMAFLMAAFTSFLPMIEMTLLNLTDYGISRKKALIFGFGLFIVFGFPSAYSLRFFTNQDWVWGLGLILSGFMVCLVAAFQGFDRLKKAWIDQESRFKLPPNYYGLAMGLNMILAVVLLSWWLGQAFDPWFDTAGHWNVLSVYSNASVLTQWAVALALAFLLNWYLSRKKKVF